jgi:hypothetical protein
MARKYARDNRGRFAAKGTGATARGGRLKTEAGNKRQTQTMRSAASTAGTIAKPRGLKPGAVKPKPAPAEARVLVQGNMRPRNLFSTVDKRKNQGNYGTDSKANVAEARRRIEASGAQSAVKSNKRSNSVASVNERSPNTVSINASHSAWRNPRADMIQSRRKNEFSTASPNHYVAHELGHVRNPSARMANSWDVQLRGKGQVYADADRVVGAKRTARRVSKYGMTSPAEFAAETSAARSLGKRYDREVMSLYRSVTGRRAPSVRGQMTAQGVPGLTRTRSSYVAPRFRKRK